MSDGTFVSLSGVVQQFGDNPVVAERDSTAGTMRDFTIRTTGNQSLVRVTVFPEQSIDGVEAGAGVFVDGSYSERIHNGVTYKNLTARTVAVSPVLARSGSSSKRAAKSSASF